MPATKPGRRPRPQPKRSRTSRPGAAAGSRGPRAVAPRKSETAADREVPKRVSAHHVADRARPANERRRRDPETLRLRSLEPAFTVDDLRESLRFYTDVLGFIVGERWEEGGQLKGVMLKAGACQLGLSQDDWAKGRNRKKGVGLRIWCQTAQDVEALGQRAREAGARVEGPKQEPWGARTLTVTDPDGFVLTFYQDLSAA